MTKPKDRPPATPAVDIRRFNLGDLAIIIAGMAFYCAAIRWAWGASGDIGWTFYTPASTLRSHLSILQSWYQLIEFGWLALTLCLTLMRLRHPRPRRRRLMRQPGWIACFSGGIAGLVAHGIDRFNELADQLLRRYLTTQSPMIYLIETDLPTYLAGTAVLISWLILALGGRWRGEPTWIDRVGRIAGIGWLVLLPVYFVIEVAVGFF